RRRKGARFLEDAGDIGGGGGHLHNSYCWTSILNLAPKGPNKSVQGRAQRRPGEDSARGDALKGQNKTRRRHRHLVSPKRTVPRTQRHAAATTPATHLQTTSCDGAPLAFEYIA